MRVKEAFLAAMLLAGVSDAAARAQGLGGFDPNQFPTLQGMVAQYSLTPRGEVDGLILDNGTEVHLPPYLGAQVVFAIKPGDQVTVRGLRSRRIPMIDAVSVTNDATHRIVTVTDTGPGTAGPALQASGHIRAQLHGPRGELNGVLLQDGTIVRLPPDQAAQMASQLAVGNPLYVIGEGSVSPLGKVIAAQQIGSSRSHLAQIQTPPPRGPGPDRRPPPPPPGGLGELAPPPPPR
jgi:hypothetical protein